MLGQKYGSYELIEEIGKGGMAAVYRAEQASMERDVAIKVILKGIANDPSGIQRFQREAKLIARLEHPHILPVYDFDASHEPPYIVMRYLSGGTLKEIMAQGLLPLGEIALLMRQICSALDYAHRQGIVHRDIKPSNILIDREGNAFVTDFGIARMSGAEDGKAITATGAVMGTPDYISPEQAMGADDLDHHTDIYALGVMLFEMLTGRLPFNGSSGMQMMLQHIQETAPSVLAFRSELSASIEAIVAQCLLKDKADRYHSALDLSNALFEALGGANVSPTQLREAAGTSILRRVEGINVRDESSTGSSEQNKTVTALYASVKEYLLLLEENASKEASRRAMQALLGEYELLVENFGGRIFLRTETAVLALWGAENARENDAEQAIRTALAMQERLKILGAVFLGDDEDESLPLNIGMNSGMALLKPSEDKSTHTASGSTLSIAERLMENANGTILVTHDTFRQVMGIFDMAEDAPLKMRGRKDLLQIYRVLAAKARAFHLQIQSIEGVETQMIGRRGELEILQKAYLNAFEDEEIQVVSILGEAGLGKSRLFYEFDKWADLRPETYRVFRGRASSNMRERAYGLLRDLVAFRFDIQDSDALSEVQDKLEKGVFDLLQRQDPEMAHTIGYLCGFELVESIHVKGMLGDIPQLIRRGKQLLIRMFVQLAKISPVMMTLEDIHDADDASLDVLNELFEAEEELRLLIVCSARPSFLEHRPTWGNGQEFHRKLNLERLEKRDSRELARELLQKVTELPKELRDFLVERSEGNPFYMEELVKMLIDERVIQIISPEEWRVELERLGALHVPKTLNGLLESRIDTLLYPEKLTLQRASVVGRIFYDSVLRKIDSADESHIPNLEAVLAKLVERQFIYKREASTFEGTSEYSFASNMLRDAIENALLERQVATYNRISAECLLELAGKRQEEYTHQIAEHYEKAGEKEKAAAYLTKASDAALLKGANPEALLLIKRALALLPDEKSLAYAEASYIFARIQFNFGETALAQSLLEKTLSLAQAFQNDLLQCKILRLLSNLYQRLGDYAKSWDFIEAASRFAGDDIEQQLLIMQRQAFHKTQYQGKFQEAEIIAKQMLELAQKHQMPLHIMNGLSRLGWTYLHQNRLDEARSSFEEGLALAKAQNNQGQIALLLTYLGEVARLQEDFAQAQAYYLEALPNYHEAQNMDSLAVMFINLGLTTLSLGDAPSARAYILESLPLVEKMNAPAYKLAIVGIIAGIKLLENQPDLGLAILGLALSHPAADADLHRDLQTVFKLLPPDMSQAEIDAGMAKGQSLDLDAVLSDFVRGN